MLALSKEFCDSRHKKADWRTGNPDTGPGLVVPQCCDLVDQAEVPTQRTHCMKEPGEFEKIDYRSPAKRLSERARTTKANVLAFGAAIAITVGLVVFAILGL
jgi:hypothetical protein